jgi:hypothetical protein
MTETIAPAGDVLFGLLSPVWQLVIALLVLVTMAVSVLRLLRRGPSRMGGAMLLIGSALVGIAVVSYLVAQI